MKKNMGQGDRIIRLSLAIILAVLFFTKQITGTARICPLQNFYKKIEIKREPQIIKALFSYSIILCYSFAARV